MQTVDEAELIARSKQNDHQAYAELVDRYKNAVYRHSFAIMHDSDAAEDIAQDTFITAFYKLESYNPEYKLATWLFRIATNKALNQLRSKKRIVNADEEIISSIVATGPSPHIQAEYAELREAVKALEPRFRACISLYYWQGLDYKEIAQVMDSPLGSVKAWMSTAKATLRKELS